MGSCLEKKIEPIKEEEITSLNEKNSERNKGVKEIQNYSNEKNSERNRGVKDIQNYSNNSQFLEINKIILDTTLPNPTKWIINGNEPFFYLSISDKYNLGKEIIELFNIGRHFEQSSHIHYNNINTKEKEQIKEFEIINRKINEIYNSYIIKNMNKEENKKLIENITEKYIKMISEENNEENSNKLFNEYKLRVRNILYEDLETLNLKTDIKLAKKKFDIFYSSFPENKEIKYFYDHPVLFGFYKAWVNHCPITISPNMIWQLILNVFIKYIDLNSEELRTKFVNFEGQKKLEVFQFIKDEITLIPTKEEWESIIDKLIIKIGENTGECILDDFILNFSTNDRNLLFVQKVSLMSMFKKYFIYKAHLDIICGYPYINLEGKIEDWELIKIKLNEFKKYGMKNWINEIDRIISKIINTKKGEIDLSFWKNIIFEHFEESSGLCGEPPPGHIILSGWLSKFFPFKNNGEEIWRVKIDSLSEDNPLSEFSITPLEVKFPNGKEKKLKILSGIIGVSQDPDTLCVKPELGFFLLDEKWGNDEKKLK